MITTTIDKPRDKIDIAQAFKLRYKNGLTYQEIADRFGVTKQAVHLALTNLTKHLPDADEVDAYRQNKTEVLECVERVLIQNLLDPEKLKTASLNNVAYSFQQVATQNRLEKGLSTENVSIHSITSSIEDIQKKRDKIIKDIQTRQVQDVVPDTKSTK